jgi:hypothetical protein
LFSAAWARPSAGAGLEHFVALGGEADAQEFADLRFVVDDQNGRGLAHEFTSTQKIGKRVAQSRSGFMVHPRLRLQRQVQGDAGAAAVDAVGDADAPAMGADHALTDRQPQPGALPAAIAAGGGVEHVENLRPLVLGNARPSSLTEKKISSSLAPALSCKRPCGGEKRAAFSSTLTSACSISAACTNSSGNSAGTSVLTCNGASTARRRLSELPTMSPAHPVARQLQAPWPRRVMSSRFWM